MKKFHRHVFDTISNNSVMHLLILLVTLMNSGHTHICGLLHITHVNLKLEMMKLIFFLCGLYHLHDIYFHWSFTFFLCVLCVIYRALVLVGVLHVIFLSCVSSMRL